MFIFLEHFVVFNSEIFVAFHEIETLMSPVVIILKREKRLEKNNSLRNIQERNNRYY